MFYTITTDDKYAFNIKKFETKEEAIKELNDSLGNYDYKAIIKGDLIFEEKNYENYTTNLRIKTYERI